MSPGKSDADLSNDFGNFFITTIKKSETILLILISYSYDSKDMPFTGDQPMESLNNLSEDEVTQLIHKAPPRTSELDPLPTHLLKQCSAELTHVLTGIINASLSNAVVTIDFRKL